MFFKDSQIYVRRQTDHPFESSREYIPTMPPIHFFFELASPYSYLASHQLDQLNLDFQREVDWRPIDIEVIWSALGVLEAYSAVRNVKRKYIVQDSQRCAVALGVPLTKPTTSARETKLAKLAYWGLRSYDRELAARFLRAAWHAHFGKGSPIGSSQELAEAATGLGLQREAIESAAQSPEARQAQDASNAAAIDLGCFGVPWFAVDGEVFFGHDRLPHLASHIRGSTAA